MLRGLVDAGMLLLLPFAAYAAFVVFSPRFPSLMRPERRAPMVQLLVAGLALAVIFFVLSGLFAPRRKGAYVPAHLENGTLVPGQSR